MRLRPAARPGSAELVLPSKRGFELVLRKIGGPGGSGEAVRTGAIADAGSVAALLLTGLTREQS